MSQLSTAANATASAHDGRCMSESKTTPALHVPPTHLCTTLKESEPFSTRKQVSKPPSNINARHVYVYVNVFSINKIDQVQQSFQANFQCRFSWVVPKHQFVKEKNGRYVKKPFTKEQVDAKDLVDFNFEKWATEVMFRKCRHEHHFGPFLPFLTWFDALPTTSFPLMANPPIHSCAQNGSKAVFDPKIRWRGAEGGKPEVFNVSEPLNPLYQSSLLTRYPWNIAAKDFKIDLAKGSSERGCH